MGDAENVLVNIDNLYITKKEETIINDIYGLIYFGQEIIESIEKEDLRKQKDNDASKIGEAFINDSNKKKMVTDFYNLAYRFHFSKDDCEFGSKEAKNKEYLNKIEKEIFSFYTSLVGKENVYKFLPNFK